MSKNRNYLVRWGQSGKKGVGQLTVSASTEKEAKNKAEKQLKKLLVKIVILDVISG